MSSGKNQSAKSKVQGAKIKAPRLSANGKRIGALPGVPRRRLNWKVIEEEFIESETSVMNFAKERGINYRKLFETIKAEGWLKKRDAHHLKRAKKKSAAIDKAAVADAVKRFRSSEDIRYDAAETAARVFKRVRAKFIDPRTGKDLIYETTPRAMKDLIDTLDKSFRLEMLAAGHDLLPETMNLNQRVLIAGVSQEQLAQLPDAELDRVLDAATTAAQLPATAAPVKPEEPPDEG